MHQNYPKIFFWINIQKTTRGWHHWCSLYKMFILWKFCSALNFFFCQIQSFIYSRTIRERETNVMKYQCSPDCFPAELGWGMSLWWSFTERLFGGQLEPIECPNKITSLDCVHEPKTNLWHMGFYGIKILRKISCMSKNIFTLLA